MIPPAFRKHVWQIRLCAQEENRGGEDKDSKAQKKDKSELTPELGRGLRSASCTNDVGVHLHSLAVPEASRRWAVGAPEVGLRARLWVAARKREVSAMAANQSPASPVAQGLTVRR